MFLHQVRTALPHRHRRYRRRVSEDDKRSRKGYAGYIPLVAIFLGVAQWTLAIPGIAAGYFGSRAVLRRVYSPDE